MANIKAIMALYESNEKFKNMVDNALAAEHDRLMKAASLFEVEKQEEVVETVKHIPHSKNHKQAICSIIAASGALSLKQLREALVSSDHEISPTTLNSVVCEMKKKGELTAVGDHGHGVYSLPTK